MIKIGGLVRWSRNGKGVWILLSLFSLRAPVTKDPENRGERPWVLCPMAFLFYMNHGENLHGFFIGLVLELRRGERKWRFRERSKRRWKAPLG